MKKFAALKEVGVMGWVSFPKVLRHPAIWLLNTPIPPCSLPTNLLLLNSTQLCHTQLQLLTFPQPEATKVMLRCYIHRQST